MLTQSGADLRVFEGRMLKSGVSALALCAMAMTAPAMAQTGAVAGPGTAGSAQQPTPASPNNTVSTTTQPDSTPASSAAEIVVTGIRQSLANSQNIKRNSDTVVDAITASDIGALPDRSVTEALQRVPGVAMNRFAGSNDPDHFSVEGSGVVVRGLTNVRSEFNGRDTFSAGIGGQSIGFQDVPAELLGSVEVYKNVTAEMIEGGLAGTVNLNTRVPFDNKGFHLGFDVEANYGDLEKRLSPTVSGLISNTWDTPIGRIGLLASVSYSEIKSKSNGLNVTNIQTRDGATVLAADTKNTFTCRNQLPGTTDTTTLPPAGSVCGVGSTPGADGDLDPASVLYAPLGGQFREEDYDTKRKGQSLAAQWQSLDRRATLTAQFLHTSYENAWGEHTFEAAPDLAEYDTYPAGCLQNSDGPNGTVRAECPVGTTQNYTYGSDGLFEKGLITYPGTGWRSASSGSATTTVPTGGIEQSLSRRQVDEKNRVTDAGLNFKFAPDDHWQIGLDGDYTRAVHNELDVSVYGANFADQYLDITGDLPVITNHKPLTLAANWASPNPTQAAENDSQYFADPNNEFWRAAMDHIEHSTGHEWAGKADIAYNFSDDVPWLKRLKFGARYADRDETVRYSTYNWGALSEVWAGSPVTMAQVPQNASLYTFKDFFRGEVAPPPEAYYYNGNLLQNYNQAASFFQSIGNTWLTTNNAGAQTPWVPLASRPGVIPGTSYLPNEIQDVSQRNTDAYAMLSFGKDEPIFGDVKVSGNIGVRYVDTRVRSAGDIFITAQSLGVQSDYATRCTTSTSGPSNIPPGVLIGQPGGICLLGPAYYAQLQQFASGTPTANIAHMSNHQWLPSLNLKFDLTSKLIARLAASKVMTLPDLADIRNSFSANYDNTSGQVTFNLGNPYLKPATAQQFDATLEWYFARVGSLTFDVFYKRVHNFFYSQQAERSFTQNGITIPIEVRIPTNYNGDGTIKGLEAAYQQTFDFLPGLFSGLGTSLSFTFLKSSGLPNSLLNGGVTDSSSTVTPGHLPLEQLSKYNVNAEAFYEKGPISLRVAYTWRSKFLLTAADVIFPYYPIYNAAEGHLDASALLTVLKGVRIGVQAVNLNNETTKTLQQYTTGGALGPRSYFISDRRYSFIVRGNW
jgi:TonB-dependent receptor